MARIDINNHNMRERKREFIGEIYAAANELFHGGNMVISISKKTDLGAIVEALAHIGEIVQVGALMIKDNDDDKADGYDGWLKPGSSDDDD